MAEEVDGRHIPRVTLADIGQGAMPAESADGGECFTTTLAVKTPRFTVSIQQSLLRVAECTATGEDRLLWGFAGPWVWVCSGRRRA